MAGLKKLNKQTKHVLTSSIMKSKNPLIQKTINFDNVQKVFNMYHGVVKTLLDRIFVLFESEFSFFHKIEKNIDNVVRISRTKIQTQTQTNMKKIRTHLRYIEQIKSHIPPMINLCDFLIHKTKFYQNKIEIILKKYTNKESVRYVVIYMNEMRKLGLDVKNRLLLIEKRVRKFEKTPFNRRAFDRVKIFSFGLMSSIISDIKKSKLKYSSINQRLLRSVTNQKLAL
jgi:hypothetical protein